MRFRRVVRPRDYSSLIEQPRIAPERESRRYSLQEKAFDGLSKGRAYSAGQTRESGIVAARRGVYALVVGDKRDHRCRRRAGYPGGAEDEQGGLLRVAPMMPHPVDMGARDQLLVAIDDVIR